MTDPFARLELALARRAHVCAEVAGAAAAYVAALDGGDELSARSGLGRLRSLLGEMTVAERAVEESFAAVRAKAGA